VTIDSGNVSNRFVCPIVLILATAFAGCRHAPHSGSAATAGDSASIQELLAYQQKAYDAENALVRFVKADSTRRWVQHEFGWWYSFIRMSDGHDEFFMYTPVDTFCPVHETVYDLEGNKLVDAIRAPGSYCKDGQGSFSDEPFAYRYMLCDMAAGDTVLMLVPWHLAYGAEGTAHIPPYTNIRVLFTMHTEQPYDAITSNDSLPNEL